MLRRSLDRRSPQLYGWGSPTPHRVGEPGHDVSQQRPLAEQGPWPAPAGGRAPCRLPPPCSTFQEPATT